MSRLPFPFILTGMIGFLGYQAASLLSMSDWLGDGIRGTEGWFHVHLFILGWATMLAMGAVYQLIHVILQTEIHSRMLGYIHYIVFTIGLTGLLYGFIRANFVWIGVCAGLTFVGILLFAWNVTATMLRAKKWNAITISAWCAILYLLLAGLTGLAMGANFITGLIGGWHERLFGAHIWIGSIGWFGLLITGFSYKMLPMFYLAHDYPVKLQTVVLILWNAAVLTGAVSFLAGWGFGGLWTALLLLTAAVIVYNAHLLQIKRHRHKKSPGAGIRWSLVSSQALACFAVLLLIYSLVFPERLFHTGTLIAAGWVYLGCWVSFTVLSYVSKIVPFLWWTYKYGKLAGKPGIPLMSGMLSENHVRIGLAAIACASLALLIATIVGSSLVTAVAAALLAICSAAYILLIGRVFLK